MFILYVDESGNPGAPDKEHVVLGGLLIHESTIRQVRREVEKILRHHLDRHLRGLEVHAQWMLNGRGPWRSISSEIRVSIVEELAAMLSDLHLLVGSSKLQAVAVIRSPFAIPGADPVERIYEELLLRTTIHAKVYGEQLMIVADDSKYEKYIQPMVRAWRDGKGTRFRNLREIAEVPLFADSKQSRLLQLADLIVHVVFRAYERSDASLFDLLLPAFAADPTTGKYHKLVHLCHGYQTCGCVACSSRIGGEAAPADTSSAPGEGQLSLLPEPRTP